MNPEQDDTETDGNENQSTPDEIENINNTRGRSEPSGITWHLINYAMAVAGMLFILYTGFLLSTNQSPTEAYYIIAMIIASLLFFEVVDRNVYYKRLYDIQSKLQEDGVKLTNNSYTSYDIHYPAEIQSEESNVKQNEMSQTNSDT